MEIWRICHQDLIDELLSRLGLVNWLMVRSTVRLVSPSCFVYRTPQGGLTDDPGLPLLMGYTYSRLGASLGSPKLRLLSVSVFSVSLLPPSPLYSLYSLGSYPSTCPSPPACCCVPRPLQLLGSLIPHLYCPPLCLPAL